VAVVDAAGEQVGRVRVVGALLRGDPVVEQVDGRAVWRNAVDDYCAIIGLNQKDLENQGILA
jgi:hypothetical protein